MHEVTSEHITGAAYPLTLKIKDKVETFQVHPLTDKDASELTYYVQAKIMDTAYKFLPPDTPENSKIRKDSIAAAQKSAAGAAWNNDAGSQILDTVEGAARLLWQSLGKKKEEITHTSLMVFFQDQENLKRMFVAFVKTSPSFFNPGGSVDWSDLEDQLPPIQLEDISKKKSKTRKRPKNSKNSKS